MPIGLVWAFNCHVQSEGRGEYAPVSKENDVLHGCK